jgi:hypothetical protein
MALRGEAYELRATGKDPHINVDGLSHRHDADSDEKVESYKQRPRVVGANGEDLDSVTRIRRLFNFSQIFAFSLTFMSTWEGMNT